jgi:hypothetical protein
VACHHDRLRDGGQTIEQGGLTNIAREQITGLSDLTHERSRAVADSVQVRT